MSSTAVTAAPSPGSSSVSFKSLAEPALAKPAPVALTTTPDRVVVVEVGAAILVVGGAIALTSGGDFCLPGADVHPLWIPALVFSARYGVRGLFIAVAMAALALTGACLIQHGVVAPVVARASSPYDMIALVGATLVAWTSMIRDGRLARSAREREETAQRLENSQETASALREVVGVMRERLDRIDLSISMWRAIAARLDHGLLTDAASAALELAAIRTGAGAGVVQRLVNFRLHTIATYGHVGTSDISLDRTVRQAMMNGRPALRGHVKGASREDSEVAVPILDPETGAVLGVLAMRDALPARLRAAEVRDLEVVAAWVADAFPCAQLQVRDGAS